MNNETLFPDLFGNSHADDNEKVAIVDNHRISDETLKAELNEPQYEAATHGAGPLLILAGAGSGKTRVITYRIARLIDEGIKPWRIIALTFTNKAAAEMKERARSLSGALSDSDPWISTFHSACLKILRRDADRIGYTKDFTVYDTRDQQRLIKEVLAELSLPEKENPPRQIAAFISRFKNRMISPAEAEKEINVNRDRDKLRAFMLYEEKLNQARCMDFDDLLGKTVTLLKNDDEIRERYQGRFIHIFVDEFQDTNAAQYQFIQLLIGDKRNICVVGDDDQSIYQWRGANVANILNFEKDFPDAKIIKLEENYRSSGNILKGAAEVVKRNHERKPKNLWTENDAGEKIHLYTASDETDEASWVAKTIRNGTGDATYTYNQVAIFYRTNSQSRALEDALRLEGIPYVVYGGLKFYERKEVKDILAYFRAAVNQSDFVSFKRIVNTPPRGIGAVTVERLSDYATENGLSLAAALDNIDDIGPLKPAAKSKLAQFREILAKIRALSVNEETTAAEALDEALTLTGYLPWLSEDKAAETASRMENLEELVSAAEDFSQRTGDSSLSAFLDQAALVADADSVDQTSGAVKLMTVHISKGLEFDAVFVTGLEDGIFPHARSKSDPSQLSEERRLMYVAMTRARKRLYLSHAKSRRVFGVMQDGDPSSFLSDIPTEIVKHETSALAGFSAYAPHKFSNAKSVKYPTTRPAATSSWAIKRAASSKPKAKSVEGEWRVGEMVNHPSFMTGKIMNVEGRGDKAKLTVYFPRFGEKKLVNKFAKLTKA